MSSLTKSCGILLVSLFLAGCASLTDLKRDVSERVFGREELNPPAELVEFKPVATPQVLWSQRLGTAANFDFSPAVDNGFVYAASANGELIKINAASGKEEWRIRSDERYSAGVGVSLNLLLVGTASGHVLAYDQQSRLLWKSKISSEVLSVPRVHDDVVVVRAGDGRIFGLNVVDGSRRWVFERSTPALTLRSSAGIVIADGVVYAGYAGGKLVAVRATDGTSLWEATVAQPKGTTEIERIADITSLPVVDGPVVFAVAYQGKVAAIDRASGRVGWSRDISSYNGISGEASRLYLTHAQGAVYSLEYASGKTFWRQGDLRYRQLSAPLPMGDLIAVGDVQGYLHFLQREDGAFAARIKTDDSPIMPNMTELDSGVLLAQTRNGSLFAVSIR